MFDNNRKLTKTVYRTPNLLSPFFGVRPLQDKKDLICFSNVFDNDFTKYKKQNHNKNKIFFKENISSFYVCEVIGSSKKSVGIIATLPLNYLNNKILRHENTLNEKVSHYTKVFKNTKVQLNPVLLFHRNVQEINTFLANWIRKKCDFQIDLESASYKLWVIHENKTIDEICWLYNSLDLLFVADGHHRLEGLFNLTEQNMFMAFLLSDNQIILHDIHRVYPNLTQKENVQLENSMRNYFTFVDGVKKFHYYDKKNIRLCIKNNEYCLYPKENNLFFDKSHYLFELLNKIKILGMPLPFNNFPCNTFNTSFNELKSNKNYAKFFIPSIKLEHLFDMIQKGEILPPHSTWFEPKLPTGLVSFHLD
jgi:uncharacterized protein (DUF1015 family)